MSKELPESPEKLVTREEVLEAYRKLVEKGAKSLGDIDTAGLEAEAAQALEDTWAEQQKKSANPDRLNFEHTTLFLDAGFNEPDYLDEVRSLLSQDIDIVEDPVLRTEIEAKIDELEKRLAEIGWPGNSEQ